MSKDDIRQTLTKVPAVTLGFWIIKIIATTLGETGGDTLSMQFGLGYLVSTGIFLVALIALVWLQISAKKFHAGLYWATIIASTTAGTTLADYADRSLGVGYTGGASLLFGGVVVSLVLWYWAEGSISVDTVSKPRVEAFYWLTITISQTLGTALGDWMADTSGLGYLTSAGIFAGALAVVLGLYLWTKVSRALLFWAAFILTRPLGATVGDFLDKPLDHGGLALSRLMATLVLGGAMMVLILVVPQKAGSGHAAKTA